MRIQFRLVDVFTDRPLAGNQLCVVPEPVDADTDLMQAIALEIGFSETTFVTEASGDRYAMRIFTPAQEIPFAGHPSLGTAFVLVSEGRVTSPVTQSVEAGEFALEVDTDTGFARMRQGAPTFGPEVDRAEVADAIGLPVDDLRHDVAPQAVSTGYGHLMAAVRAGDAVSRCRPHDQLLMELLRREQAGGVYVFHASGNRAQARLFFSARGIKEDPATGSAAGPLGAYLAEYGLTSSGRLTVSQGEEMGRPSTLLVDVEGRPGDWTIHVGGGVAKVGEGWFDLA